MLIGLISDTHMPWEQKELPPEVFQQFKGVDLILHAGDIYSHTVLDDLEKIAPVLAAKGDDDYPSDDPRIKEHHVLEIEGHTLLLIHEGPYLPISREHLKSWWRNHQPHGKDGVKLPDIIVSGHEHRVLEERSDGILYVSSGSPTLLHYKHGPGTIGLLDVRRNKVDVRIIQLEEEASAV